MRACVFNKLIILNIINLSASFTASNYNGYDSNESIDMNDTPDGSVRGLLDAYLKSHDPNTDDQSVVSTDSEVSSQDIADDVVSKYAYTGIQQHIWWQ